MRVGDLIKWTDYTKGSPVAQVGLLAHIDQQRWATQPWGDIMVMTGKGIEIWVSWQCEILNEATVQKEKL
jgi:hypothetical protein